MTQTDLVAKGIVTTRILRISILGTMFIVLAEVLGVGFYIVNTVKKAEDQQTALIKCVADFFATPNRQDKTILGAEQGCKIIPIQQPTPTPSPPVGVLAPISSIKNIPTVQLSPFFSQNTTFKAPAQPTSTPTPAVVASSNNQPNPPEPTPINIVTHTINTIVGVLKKAL
jgi:hypothetical protein